ncbi:hypothetical protein Efla_005017 [Eimeria flavescens]
METPLRMTCLLVLDSEGERLCVKYLPPSPAVSSSPFPYCDFAAQRRFETAAFQALKKIRGRTEPEVLEVEGEIAVGLSLGDVCLFAASPQQAANELLLVDVVECLKCVLVSLCNGNLSRQALIDGLDAAMLALDEVADQGLLLETNPSLVVARASLLEGQMSAGEAASFNRPAAAAVFRVYVHQAITQAKDSLIKSLLSGAS